MLKIYIPIAFIVSLFIFASCTERPHKKGDNLDQLYDAAMGYYASGKHEKALPLFDELIEHRPDEALFYGLRAESYGALGLESNYVADWCAAVELYDPKRDKDNWEFFQYARALEAFKHGDYQQAIQLLTRLIKATPNDPMAYALRAESLVCLDQLSNSLPDWEKALSISDLNNYGEDKWQHFNMEKARTHFYIDDWTNAVRHLTIAVDNNYDLESALGLRSVAYYEIGQYEVALADISRLMALTGTNDVAAIEMHARIMDKMGRYEEALTDYRMMVAMGEGVDIAKRGIDRITEKMGTATSDQESQ